MYDLNLLSTYLLLAFGIVLLAFPEYLQQFSPENSYMKKLIEYKQPIAISSIAVSLYLYLSNKEDYQDTIIESTLDTISSTLTTPISTTLPSTQ